MAEQTTVGTGLQNVSLVNGKNGKNSSSFIHRIFPENEKAIFDLIFFHKVTTAQAVVIYNSYIDFRQSRTKEDYKKFSIEIDKVLVSMPGYLKMEKLFNLPHGEMPPEGMVLKENDPMHQTACQVLGWLAFRAKLDIIKSLDDTYEWMSGKKVEGGKVPYVIASLRRIIEEVFKERWPCNENKILANIDDASDPKQQEFMNFWMEIESWGVVKNTGLSPDIALMNEAQKEIVELKGKLVNATPEDIAKQKENARKEKEFFEKQLGTD